MIRNVLRPERDTAISHEIAESASAGIAARLLDAPAVCNIPSTDASDAGGDVVYALIPLDEKDAQEIADSISSAAGGGGSLGTGDVFATSCYIGAKTNDCNWRRYAGCSKDDPSAFFIDTLYGSKGETPTTVIQWSKGTVHYNSQ